MALKLKVKKTLLKRKVNGATLPGYYGRVITNGKKSFEDIVTDAGRNTTMHKAELKMAGELLLDSIADGIKQGYIVDLGPLGALYPAVNGTWKQDPKELSLSEMKPKVNYKPSDDIAGAVRGATLAWTTEAETKENTVDDEDNQTSDLTEQPASTGPVLTVTKTGAGSFTLTNQTGQTVESGAAVPAGHTLTLRVSAAGSATPTATIGAQTVTLVEDEGRYVGTFLMPSTNATLTVKTGGSGDNED